MMIYCYFIDFNAIRNFVEERFADWWYERSVPLPALAALAQAAFELFHQMECELRHQLNSYNPVMGSYDFMMEMLFYTYGIDHVDYDAYENLSKEEADDRIWRDEADWLALPSYWTLIRLRDLIPYGKVPMLPPSERKPIKYGNVRLPEWNDFHSAVTNHLIMQVAHLKALKKNDQIPFEMPSEPKLLFDLMVYLELKIYWSALIFSLHLWIDLRHIMETDVELAFKEMQKSGRKLYDALQSHTLSAYTNNRGFKRAWYYHTLDAKQGMIDDFMFEDMKARLLNAGVTEDPEPFSLLRNEPVWSGLLDLRARLVHSYVGQQFINLSSIVDTAAYLYHAARAAAADPPLPPWSLLDEYIAIFQEDSPFRLGLQGQKPVDIIFNLGERVSLSGGRWERVARPNIAEKYIPAVAIRETLYGRYTDDSVDQPADFVQFIRQLKAQIAELNGEQVDAAATSEDDDGAPKRSGESNGVTRHGSYFGSPRPSTSRGGGDQQNEDQQPKRKLPSVSPVEMLQLLDKVVTEQVTGFLTLDFKLFDQSVMLLERVVEALGPEMERRLEPRNEASSHLDKLGVFIVQDLRNASEEEKERMVGRIVTACREFAQKLPGEEASN
ncbi:hypothetical protein VTJ04DRAFT_5729 [Mycothermus thermophilus]|uniref:uncharacterized protein n=1 Tax=Humicola insolens TaxID=85995 RepID=UPI00374227D4